MAELKPPASRTWRLNGFNRLLVAIGAALLVALCVQVIVFAPWNRQHYGLAACSPRGFPVEAWVTLAGGGRVLFKFDTLRPNATVEQWGEPSALADGAWKALPDRIDVHFVSLQERRYYAGSFALPADVVRKTFADAERAGKLISISTPGLASQRRQGLTFAVCMANDGGAAIWLRGMDFQQALLKTRLQPRTPPRGALVFGRPMPLDQFINDNFHGYGEPDGRAYLREFDASRDWLETPTGWPDKNPERTRSLQ